jgi:hypothetical protein
MVAPGCDALSAAARPAAEVGWRSCFRRARSRARASGVRSRRRTGSSGWRMAWAECLPRRVAGRCEFLLRSCRFTSRAAGSPQAPGGHKWGHTRGDARAKERRIIDLRRLFGSLPFHQTSPDTRLPRPSSACNSRGIHAVRYSPRPWASIDRRGHLAESGGISGGIRSPSPEEMPPC